MKRIELGTILALLMSLAVFGYAQQSAQDPGAAAQEEPNKHQEVPPPPRQPEVKPPRGQEEAKPPKQQPEAKPPKTEKQEQQKPAHEHGASAEQRQARPSGKSAHIPDPKFRANFGKQHTFTVNRVITTTTIVPNQTQFVFAGYTFIFLDPWPAGWLFTDDCYVDYVDDDYFLFDVLHPGVRVALFVVG